ncbi:hypothetical protein RNJ44_01536 [Nakaseomyces bracarensis]|uniref:Uncharacterized protein n=1 Tax=Nakaseomyces bracarensis TaxID=273131 RepID=A0ABR4NQ20_9SACH
MSLRNINSPPTAKEDDIHPPFPVTRRRSSNYIDALNVHKSDLTDTTNMNLQDAKHAITSQEQNEHENRNNSLNQGAESMGVEKHVNDNMQDLPQGQRPGNQRRRSSFDYEDFKKSVYNKMFE